MTGTPMTTLVPAALWALWCALHSLLVLPRATRWLGGPRRHRLVYNLVALLTLVPLLVFTHATASPQIWRWSGWWRFPQLALAGAGLALFAAGARHYDLRQFLGLGRTGGAGISRGGGIDRSGVLGLVRHPWYLAGILLVWARDLRTVDLGVSIVLTLYFVVGARLEERRLVAAFGDRYRDYQRRVPMLVPRPGALFGRRGGG